MLQPISKSKKLYRLYKLCFKKKVKNRTFLVSVDVTSHGKYIIKRVVCRAYKNFYKDNFSIPSYYLRGMLRLILKENSCHFNGKHPRTAMGKVTAVSFPNIFITYIETQILRKQNVLQTNGLETPHTRSLGHAKIRHRSFLRTGKLQ